MAKWKEIKLNEINETTLIWIKWNKMKGDEKKICDI